MKILIWATTLQADILSLALHLDGRSDCSLMVVCEGREAFLAEPIARARPLRCPLLERHDRGTQAAARAFGADVVVFDNHIPEFPAAPRAAMMWHGLGWKAQVGRDVDYVHEGVRRLTGRDPREAGSGASFLAQCYGEDDWRCRVEDWGLAPETCRIIGMPYSDLLLSPPYDRQALASHYRKIDVVGRRTVLLSFTWHYGRIFPGEWRPRGLLRPASPVESDLAFLEALFETIGEEGANVLFCLHDRKRYEAHYLAAVHELAARFPHVELKHKCEHPDNLADLVVADAMVSNLSSFITFFYLSGGPTVHICPPLEGRESVSMARLSRGKVQLRKDPSIKVSPWMKEPEDNGGLTVYSPSETLAAVRRAVREPDCCRARAASFLERHAHGIDGQTCARFAHALMELVSR